MPRDLEAMMKNLPGVRSLLERRYERRFASEGYGWFRGVFSSFEEASRSAPHSKPVGFDHAAYTREFESRLSRIFSFDYPVIYWLAQLLAPDMTLFDFGGHRGTHFYAYAPYLRYPAGFRWIVCDLPEIVAAGKVLAEERQASGLLFTTNLADATGADVFLAAGSLQYVEAPSFAESLASLAAVPKHLLLNKVPLYPGKRYVTLQNGGPAFHPQYVFNRDEFVTSITSLGYTMVDQWDVPSHPGRIPFHPEASFLSHSGLYFRRTETT